MSAKWKERRTRELQNVGKRKTEQRAMAIANGQSIDGIVRNVGPDPSSKAGGCARVVFNMSNETIPKFCADSTGSSSKAYLNAYDLAEARRVGGKPKRVSQRRQMVDDAVSKITKVPKEDMYFGAVEMSGSGVRFYGDYCLVLKVAHDKECVLDRNSFDIARPPLAPNGPLCVKRMERAVDSISGTWGADLGHMLVVKAFQSVPVSSRRLTLGQVSTVVLNDEDYVEVVRNGSFNASDVDEVRTSATESARQSAIGDRASRGPIPTLAEMLWRERRLEAEVALEKMNLKVRVVTAPGRIR
ncbi:hypothetical protein [Ralstonia solanacearum]|uniref:hypothetical protein n=1 Tax=Ralstonia solanacearum TaxID=305 RepID=UPI00078C57E3|nr:hypothetical protein [Ralstonia solanacearum]AMP36996.1 hypothetical protein LBM2029_05315 [Ralstonia solanacearum]AXV85808.1 hypothetical protein CJO78_05540 [Ralstonia solanacearum]AXW05317.1 hypothetical protein CJO82_05315 [Ralstonia solanacearum]AXW23060.1 hypothetical protein CJO86_05335 [Ralstonia solanacearum]AXW80006.1 hypothetical protein CJO98_05555 [Ralstonia solanacearum]